jgi:UDP-3-O-[3-hydroxymyristoyl] glucosamine N-acyltransferase
VTNDLEAGKQVWGTPAQPLAEARRTGVALRHLPGMRKQLQQLQRQVSRLEKQLADREREG